MSMTNQTGAAAPPEADHYAVLGISPDAAPDVIRRAYRDQAQDAMMNDRPRFEALTAAFDTLKDPKRRAEYDRVRSAVANTAVNATQGFAAAPNATRAMPLQAASTALTVTNGAPQAASGGDPNRTRNFELSPCAICQTQSVPGEDFCLECGFLLGSVAGKPLGAARPLPRLVDATGREFVLRRGENTVGREGADIALPDKSVSRRHARVVVEETGAVWVEDTGSTNGSKLAGQPLSPGRKASLSQGDRLLFGSVQLTAIIPVGAGATQRALPATAPPAAAKKPVAALASPKGQASAAMLRGANGAAHTLAGTVTTVGRKPSNSLVISGDSFVSSNHAEIRFEAGKFVLLDVNSTNGTKWNGRKVPAGVPQVLADGDEIVFGRTPWTFHAPGGG